MADYDHGKKTFHEACGYTEAKIDSFGDQLTMFMGRMSAMLKTLEKDNKVSRSRAIEFIQKDLEAVAALHKEDFSFVVAFWFYVTITSFSRHSNKKD